MKTILFMIAFLVIPASTMAAIPSTPVQQPTCSSSGASCPFTITAPTAGDFCAVMIGGSDATKGVSSITGCGSSSWTKAVSSTTNSDMEIWYLENASGSSTAVTVTLTGTPASTMRGTFVEWAGVATSSSIDASATSGHTGTSADPATATVTPTASKNTLILTCTRKGGTFNTGPDSPFTALATANSGFQAAYDVVANTAGSFSTAWHYSTSTAYDSVIAGFMAPAGGGGSNAAFEHGAFVVGF